MKRTLVLLLVCFVLNASTKAQYAAIPDPDFRSSLLSQFPACFNTSQMLDTICAATQTSIYVSGAYTNFDGLQYFKNLQVIYLAGGSGTVNIPNFPASVKTLSITGMVDVTTLTSYPDSLEVLGLSGNIGIYNWPTPPATLRKVQCAINSGVGIPVLPNTLDTLICSQIQLYTLPPLPDSLKYLECYGNYLISLPALPSSLKFLNCSDNQITGALPTLPEGLVTLNANTNQISSVPNFPSSLASISIAGQQIVLTIPPLPDGATYVEISDNGIGNLPSLPSHLVTLYAQGIGLTYLPPLPATLLELECQYNQLTSLPALPASLYILQCQYNQLTSLPSLPAGLGELRCNHNQLTNLPPLPLLAFLDCTENHIYCLPFLQNGSGSIQIYIDDIVTCIPNHPTPAYDIGVLHYVLGNSTITHYNSNDYPLCSSLYNYVYQCKPYPQMTGYVYNDNNNNGVKDAGEPYRANVKVGFSNSYFTMTNSNGYYEIPADTTGNFTLTITPPNYYTSVPLQYNYSFSSYDTVVTGNFALHATAVADSLTISISPVKTAARKGFAYPYLISYTNEGTTTLTPNIVLNYDNSRLDYDSSSNATVSNSGSALSLAETAMVAGQQKSFIGYFTIKTTAVIGDSVKANVNIHADAVSASDSTAARIRSSFDPNDKTATPALSPAAVAEGDYIYYTVRFQNTGTDTAFHVLIVDALSDQLQPATLQVVSTSHPCQATIIGDSVYFEFHNILLPDSNVNEMKSHGFVSFRIKPQPSVTLNTLIQNRASIYFDFNSPVTTNTAATNIGEPLIPFELVSFNVTRTSTSSADVTWSANYEGNNVQSYSIEMSLFTVNFNSIATQLANGNQASQYTKSVTVPNNTLYFRLKIIYVDGSYSYSPIVIIGPYGQPTFELTSFTVTRTAATTADVQWNTNNEAGYVQSYDIEMSPYQVNFTSIASQTANGNQLNNYTRTVSVANSILYFRLKILHVDGSFTYSPTVVIQPQVVPPFQLISFNVTRTSATNAAASWSTSNEANNIQSYDIQTSTDQLNFTGIASQTANGNQSNNYTKSVSVPNTILYFRLKILNIDGSFTYSPIVVVQPQAQPAFELNSFNVIRTDAGNATVNWSTNNENSNVQSYDIEMSADQLNFAAIASQAANGNQANNYTKPVSVPNTILYFRLKITHVDGSITYSSIVIIQPQAQLPFELVSFTVTKAAGNNANVYWNTKNETSVQLYNIEMSVDETNYTGIAAENANGNQQNEYTKAIAIPTNNILYFRLKITDGNGNYTYSQVVTLTNDQSQSFTIANNPVKDELKIAVLDNELKNMFANIYNAQGSLIKKILLQQDVETVNVRALSAGVYILVTVKGSRQFIVVK